MPFTFEKLLVYQKAMSFADAICTLTRDFPRGYYFLVDQLTRASLSIAANIAEGNGRFTKADRRNFFGIARGSVQECVPLLELAARQKLLKSEQHERLKAELEEIARMFSVRLLHFLERLTLEFPRKTHFRHSSKRHRGLQKLRSGLVLSDIFAIH
ncbi:MAG: four helix bundle protein, partial [Planctomycetia bacterium]|nr:four helix bundle protein [Planctomycetia bacterium]